tara:strand:- start:1763 stop:2218 length:456 start_codon:yes stop_codon:yes gene_type:complete
MNKQQKRSARCLCIQLLYSLELSDSYTSQDIVDYFFKSKDDDVDQIVYNENEINYAKKLLDYTIKHIEKIDKIIQKRLVNWDMHRLAVIDKIILRMCISEMLYMEDVPPKVSMAEGIEIAKQFSTNDSSSFINGVLDAVYNENKKQSKEVK